MIRALIKTICLSLAIVLVTGASTALAFDPFGNACSTGNNGGSQSAVCQDKGDGSTNPLTGQNGLFRGITNVIALSTGIIAVILIIIGGFKYITADGDAAKAKSAKETIVAALLGLVIIILAGSIISLVLNRL